MCPEILMMKKCDFLKPVIQSQIIYFPVVHPFFFENYIVSFICLVLATAIRTVELKWLEHLWNHENMFETGVVRANEC